MFIRRYKEKWPQEGSDARQRPLLATGLQVSAAPALCKRRLWSPASKHLLWRGHSVS